MNHYVIIGAGSGIGKAVAASLCEHHRITAIGRSNAPALNENVSFHTCDVTEAQPQFPEITGPVHGLIYAPGSITLKPFRALKQEDFLHDLQVNLLGAVKTIQHYLPRLQEAEHASVVLFSTVAVQTGLTFHSSIAAAKGAVEGLTRSLAAEFAPKIRVNAVAPSLTNTALAEKLLNSEAKVNAAAERHPMKRVGTASDVAQAVQYLLNATWVTGEIMHVDGGMHTLR